MKRLRVLTLLDKPVSIGGAERLACEISIGLDPQRYERFFCATRKDAWPQLDGQLKAAGVEYLALDRTRRFDLGAWSRFVAFLRREKIDVLHSHLFGSNLWGSVLGKAAGVPVVVAHEHTWAYEGARLRMAVDRNVIARLADRVIAVSEADRAKMIERVGIPAKSIVVIPNGIPPLGATSGANVRAGLGISPTAPVLGTVIVLRPQKRVDRLIEASALLRPEFPDLRVLVVGDGYAEERAAAVGLIDRLQLKESVLLLGQRSDIPDILGCLDVGVLSSDFEGMPLAVIEYMAAGLPVVATAVGGIPEVVEHGVTGVVVNELSAEALSEGIASLLRDPARARRMGQAGRSRQLETYSLAAMIEHISDLYEELYAASRRGGRSA